MGGGYCAFVCACIGCMSKWKGDLVCVHEYRWVRARN